MGSNEKLGISSMLNYSMSYLIVKHPENLFKISVSVHTVLLATYTT
jgi:hypothetical protein